MWVRKTAEGFKEEKGAIKSIKSIGVNLLVALAVTAFAFIWDQSLQFIVTCFIFSFGASIVGSIFFDDPLIFMGFIFSGQASPSDSYDFCPSCQKLVERSSEAECECGVKLERAENWKWVD